MAVARISYGQIGPGFINEWFFSDDGSSMFVTDADKYEFLKWI
jgi:hypothetical protein